MGRRGKGMGKKSGCSGGRCCPDPTLAAALAAGGGGAIRPLPPNRRDELNKMVRLTQFLKPCHHNRVSGQDMTVIVHEDR